MPQRALLVPLGQLLRAVIPQDPVVSLQKVLGKHLVRRHQERAAGTAAQKVVFNGGPELELPRRLFAKDDHVGEILALLLDFLGGRVLRLAEDAAGGEDLSDCIHDEFGGRVEEVTGVVL